MSEVITFNHISKTLSVEKRQELTDLYYFYHKRATCYKWLYKRLKRKKIVLEVSAIGLVSLGGAAGGITLNPIVIGVLSGVGALLGLYVTKSNLVRNVESSKFAYTSYEKILTQIRGYLRGMQFQEDVFFSDLRILGDIVTDWSPPLGKLEKKYEGKFKLDPTTTTTQPIIES